MAEKWYERALRRNVVDMHIPDWNEEFMSQVGALLMGRRTHDVVAGLGQWPYGHTPVLVATHRDLEPAADTIRAVTGDIAALITQAKEAAGDRDVYLDGADLVRQGLEAGLVDELCITYLPTLLGAEGVRLFDGLQGKVGVEFGAHHRLGHMLQVTARIRSSVPQDSSPLSPPARSTPRGSSPGTAGGTPPRSRTPPHPRSPS